MFKWILVLVAVVAIAVSTGLGAKAWHAIDRKISMHKEQYEKDSLQARIEENLRELKDSRKAVFKQLYELRSRAASERNGIARHREESEKLDSACKRIAEKINTVSLASAGTDTGSAGVVAVSWGPHELNRTQATKLLMDWGQSVDRLKLKIAASERKVAGYEKALEALQGDGKDFSASIEKLEAKLQELLTAREVLQVQHQVSEILATVQGRDVPGETADLFGELQSENDRLKAEIEANGFAATNDALIGPEDDLSRDSKSEILERYGVTSGSGTGAVVDF